MPRDPAIEIRGAVTALTAVDAELALSGDVFGAAPAPELVLSGTVSSKVHQAVTGATSAHGVEIRIGGVAVPEADLAGPIEITEDIDSPTSALRFTLRGSAYSYARTLSTWTRVPVEVIGYHAPVGGPEISRVEFRGHLVPGSGNQRGGLVPVLELVADTRNVLGDDTICLEIAPDSGITRAEIASAVIASVPVSAPGGQPYPRGVIVANQRPTEFLRAWGDAAGWSWRLVPAADPDFVRLEGFVAELETPSDTWTVDETFGIDVEPPQRPLSEVVVRGVQSLSSTSISEGGVEIEVETVEITRPYAPLEAVQEQLQDGTVVPVSSSSQEADRVVQRLETETHRQGGREILVITRDYGYYNPRAARLRTPNGGEPDGPDEGYYPTRAWIDDGGECRFWRAERFGLRGERRVSNTYDPATGEKTQTEIEDYRLFTRTAGVKQVLAGAPGPWVLGIAVGTDDQSYRPVASEAARIRIEEYGLAERHTTFPRWEDGAEVGKTERSYGYYAPRAAVDVDTHHLRYDGTAQAEVIANWREVRELETDQGLTPDKRITSKSQSEKRWHGLVKHDGAHDWGGGDFSNRVSEIYRLVERRVTIYRRRGDGTTEKVTISDRPPDVEDLPDLSVPLPRFVDSPWTLAREEPIEHRYQDPAAAVLWGPASEVLESEYLTTATECEQAAARKLRRSQARRARVRRPMTLTRLGQTVRLVDPQQHLDQSVLVSASRRIFAPATGAWTVDYTAEMYP